MSFNNNNNGLMFSICKINAKAKKKSFKGPPRGRGAGGGEFLCFNCRKSGHMARDCKEK